MMIDSKQVGAAMKQARVLAGFSVRELAERAEMMDSTIRAYEAGRMLPGFWNLCHIADALDIGLDELVGRHIPEPHKGVTIAVPLDRVEPALLAKILAYKERENGQKPD